MLARLAFVSLALVVFAAATGPGIVNEQLPLPLNVRGARGDNGCPTTVPNGYTPAWAQPSANNHGAGNLVTALWVWRGLDDPRSVDRDGSIYLKLGWFRGVEGELTISGERIDGPAVPLLADSANDGYPPTGFLPSALRFPTRGCWRITARLADTTLVLVLQIRVGRDVRLPPSASLLPPQVHGRTVRLRWRATGARRFDVALRRLGRPWRRIQKGESRTSYVITSAARGKWEARVRATDLFGVGPWSAARRFRVP